LFEWGQFAACGEFGRMIAEAFFMIQNRKKVIYVQAK
jgi:hypothetical protein